MADTKLTGLTELSVPALDDWLYTVDKSDTTDDAAGSSRKIGIERVGGILGHPVQGRLTTETGVGISTTNRTSQGTLYFTPWFGNAVRIYDGTRWKVYNFTERSLSLTLTSGKNYDVFIYDNAGTLTLELSAAWTNDTTRADALATQDGVKVKSGATTRLWLGTIRASGTNVVEFSESKCFVWNAYNQVPVVLFVEETTASWTYTGTANWRQVRATSTNQVEVVVGDTTPLILNAQLVCQSNTAASAGMTGIGIDSTTAIASRSMNGYSSRPNATDNPVLACNGSLTDRLAVGYHYMAWLESNTNAAATITYSGTSSAFRRSAMGGFVLA